MEITHRLIIEEKYIRPYSTITRVTRKLLMPTLY